MPGRFEPGYLDRLDGRTAIALEMRARWQEMTDDLGGADALSYAQRSLVDRALWMEHYLAQQEIALGEGRADDFSPNSYAQCLNTYQGLLSRLGLERRPRDVTTLADYIASKAKAVEP